MKRWTREDLARRSDVQVADISQTVLNRVAKWRSVFTGWQLGTRLDKDAESKAVRDHREVTMMLRIESSAIAALLIEKGVFSAREFTEQLIVEAELLDADLERRFPGMKATDAGIAYELPLAAQTMKDWRP